MPSISVRAYARRRGVSHVAVLKAIREGRITATRTGRKVAIDPKKADREWARNTDPSKPLNSVSGDPRRRRPPGEPSAPMVLAGPQNAGDQSGTHRAREDLVIPNYNTAKTIHEAYKARMAKLEYELAEGQAVDAEEVRGASFDTARRARDLLIDIPERMGSMLSPEAYTALRTEIARVCSELAGVAAPTPKRRRKPKSA